MNLTLIFLRSQPGYRARVRGLCLGALLCLSGAGLGGCASSGDMQFARTSANTPLKIVVVESPFREDAKKLDEVFAPDVEAGSPSADALVTQGVDHAEDTASTSIESALANQGNVVIVNRPPQDSLSLDDMQGYGTAISQDEANRIHASTGADALLRFGITDYGLTPASWKKGYITFEVTSTLALAGVIAYAGTAAAKAAAGAYLVQETAEESASAYAGFWSLDVVCRPVRIEAELVLLKPVMTVWQTSDTGLSDIRLSRLTGKTGVTERARQLDQATEHAAKGVVSDLASALEYDKPARYWQGN